MKIVWQDFVWQFLFSLLVVFFGGWILGSVINLAAMASPQMVSTIYCPAGSTATWNQQNQNGPKLSCYDQDGKSIPPLSDAESVVLQRKYFFRPSFIIMIILAIGWFVRSLIQQMRNQVNL